MNYYLDDILTYIKADSAFSDYTYFKNAYRPAPKYLALLDRSSNGIEAQQDWTIRNFMVQLMNPNNGQATIDIEYLAKLLNNKSGHLATLGTPVSFRYVQCTVQPQRLETDDNRNGLWFATFSTMYIDNTISTIYS